jgi:hypothetical protein
MAGFQWILIKISLKNTLCRRHSLGRKRAFSFGSFSLGKPCGIPFYGPGFAGIPQGQAKKMNNITSK